MKAAGFLAAWWTVVKPAGNRLRCLGEIQFPKWRAQTLTTGLAVSFVAIHVLKIGWMFRRIDFSLPVPILNTDFLLYYTRVLRMLAFHDVSGRFWGYDPFQMAGYPAGPVDGAGLYGVGIIAIALRPLLHPGRLLLIVELFGYLSMPFILALALRVFGASWRAAWTGMALFTVFYGMFGHFSQSFSMFAVGSFMYQVACVASIAVLAYGWRFFERRTVRAWAAFSLALAVLPLIHPSAVMIVGPPLTFAALIHARRARPRHVVLLAATAGLVFAVNWYWVKPYWAYRDFLIAVADYLPAVGWKGLVRLFSPLQSSIHGFVRAALHVAVVGFAVRAIFDARHERARAIFFAGTFVYLGTLGYFGDIFPHVERLQPHRFSFAFWLFSYVLAAIPLSRYLHAKTVPQVIAPAAAVVLLGLAVLVQDVKATFYNSVPDDQRILIAVLRGTQPPGRVLLETREPLAREPGLPHIADLVPSVTHASLVGGPNPGNFLKTSFGDFTNVAWRAPEAFDRPLETMAEGEFAAYLDRYAASLVVAQTAESVAFLDRYTDTLERTPYEPWTFYRVRKPVSWLIEGTGSVIAGLDRLVISEASAGRLILKYHWIKTLYAEDGVKIFPVQIGDDPVPFIGVDNSAAKDSITIRNGDV